MTEECNQSIVEWSQFKMVTMTTLLFYSMSNCKFIDKDLFTFVHCIGPPDDDDDVAEALATSCVVNTKLRRVKIEYMSPLLVIN